MRWYRKAADQGHAGAQSNLGNRYRTGQGVKQDSAAAVRWYRKAAAQGSGAVQYSLGLMYYQGKGVPEDYVQAYMWWELAAARGVKIAGENRDVIAKDMTAAHIAEAGRLAREWKPKKK